MKMITRLMLLSLGAGAAVLWRSQQARDKATQALNLAKDKLQATNLPLPKIGQTPSSSGAGQPQRSSPATTTMLSQTAPGAGVNMSRGGPASQGSSGGSTDMAPGAGSTAATSVDNVASDTTAQSSDTARSTARSAEAERAIGEAAEANTTLASDEDSIAQPVFHPIGEQERDGSMADIPADSLAQQSSATASELVQSSHQPDSMEVSESPEQTHTTVETPRRGVSTTPTFRPANDPDAGQLDADGEDRTITDRVRSRLGQELDHAEWGHININTQAFGVVYLRGYVASDELCSRIEQITSETEGVESVVNELHVGEQGKA